MPNITEFSDEQLLQRLKDSENESIRIRNELERRLKDKHGSDFVDKFNKATKKALSHPTMFSKSRIK